METLSPDLYRDLIGTPWKLHARGPYELDCVGLLLIICRRRGYLVRDLASTIETVQHRDSTLSDWLQIKDHLPGDALLFRGFPRPHVGVAIDSFRMVHAQEHVGVVVERYDSPLYARRLQGVYRCRLSPSVLSQS